RRRAHDHFVELRRECDVPRVGLACTGAHLTAAIRATVSALDCANHLKRGVDVWRPLDAIASLERLRTAGTRERPIRTEAIGIGGAVGGEVGALGDKWRFERGGRVNRARA